MDDTRRVTVQKARDAWVEKLIDLSHRNRLLYFRETKTGSLDLSQCDSAVLGKLLQGTSVTLAKLLPNADEVETSARAKTIRRTAKANRDERGLETLFVALGFASWPASDKGSPVEAPILLVPIRLDSQGREGRAIRLQRGGDLVVNDVLLFSLEREHGVQIATEELLSSTEANGETPLTDPKVVCGRLQKAAGAVKELQISDGAALSNFSYRKMAMVRELQANLDQLVEHDLVAALAGDPSARESMRFDGPADNPRELDLVLPNNEFLVLDADSSQQMAIAGALSLKRNGVIQGPPGTGKSQTIANLICELVAKSHRVLFVAEKRAALNVVLDRLEKHGLSHLALDLHGADITRTRVMNQFKESLSVLGDASPVDSAEVHRRFEDRRKRLNDHVQRLHAPCRPSRLTVYDLQGRLLRFGADEKSSVRWGSADLDGLTPAAIDEACDLLLELEGFERLFLRTEPSEWFRVKSADGRVVQQAIDALRRLTSECWPAVEASIATIAGIAKTAKPATLEEVRSWLGLLHGIEQTLVCFQTAIFEQNLEWVQGAYSPATNRFSALRAWLFSSHYREAGRKLRSLRRNGEKSRVKLLESVTVAAAQTRRWKALAPTTLPAVPANLRELRSSLDRTVEELELLGSILQREDLPKQSIAELQRITAALTADSAIARRLPRLLEIENRLAELGIGKIVEHIRQRRAAAGLWTKLLEHAWLASCHERAIAEDARLAGFNGSTHQRFRDEFCELDAERLKLAVQRVRRAHAEQAVAVRNAHPDQEDLVRHEAQKKGQHLPFRQLLARAPDVLTALRPCWLASPLSVSELIPSTMKFFDIVLFDEASQILPEDAIPALMRGSKAVVAGDENQLPPTTFFDGGALDGGAMDDDGVPAAVDGFESLLAQMRGLIGEPWLLKWHYRSLDESLIAFSNRYIYGDRLITFPGPGGPSTLSHVMVSAVAPQAGQEESSSEEIRKVVGLILEHAAQRPSETLGVIAMGIKHAQRVQAALDHARISRPELDDFFNEDNKEGFFVKNLERVQGDERDAIILTIGYGKDASGKLLYQFGPLNKQGGERRLNVAITRARRRMTVVSSFDDRDMDPERTKARGVELLRLYLEYARNRGQRFGDQGTSGFPENSFEADVFNALQVKGLQLIPQFGVSSYRLDFAAKHPKRPGRMVLAIECDGASYHSAYTARDRDRLRQQHLEALGWRFHRIWSTDWFTRRDEEINRAVIAFNAAVAHADRKDAPGGETSPVASPTGGKALQNGSFALVGQRYARPAIPKRTNIEEYSMGELIALLRWIESDEHLRTDNELGELLFAELKFKRHGTKIDQKIANAIERYRRAAPQASQAGASHQ